MKTSIATVSLSGDLSEKIQAIARAGFDGVEIFENDFIAFDHSPREVGAMVRDAGMVVTLFQPFRDFEGLPEPYRQKAFDRAERKFDVMEAIGTDLILVCSSVSPHALGGIDRAAGDLCELGDRAARRGLRIGFEALAWGRFVSDHRDAWEIVRRADHPAVGLILDSFHTLSRGLDVASIRAIPKDRIFLVQLADAPKLQLDILSWSRHFRNMPGQGDLPVEGFLEAVRATGYDGFVSLEIFNDQFRAGSASMVAVDGRRSLVDLDDRISKRIGPPAKTPLPPRSTSTGVEFIEFAVDAEAATELGTLLGALGFRQTGKHKSKDVTLWTQNGVNLLVNSEREGFAHSSYIVHGPSVCALCLRVADAGQVMDRAEALLAMPFAQDVPMGQLDIPAIRGVGGSLIYFIDERSDLARLWDIDFDRSEAPAGGGAGLVGIDHVAQSMDYDEMLSWLLFYTSILDVAKTPGLDIPDPGGLVRSLVVQNADRSLNLVLNGSQSQQTGSARFFERVLRLGRAAHGLRQRRHLRQRPGDRGGGAEDPADPRQLLPRPRSPLRPARGVGGRSQGAWHPLRPGRGGGVPPDLHHHLQGPLLLRDRRAARLYRLRADQRGDPAGGAKAPLAQPRRPALLTRRPR